MSLLTYAKKNKGLKEEADPTSEYFKRLILASHPIIQGTLTERVNEIFKEAFPEGNEVYVISEQEKNAFCIPTGDVFITTGLLDSLSTIPQLKFILGHEMSHVSRSRKQIATAQNIMEYLHQARLEESTWPSSA